MFYLMLRGLDTIEDDMTLPDEKKQPLLRQFHQLAVQPGWTFTESGPNEKDRQLLVEWTVVCEELHRLEPRYEFQCSFAWSTHILTICATQVPRYHP